MRHLGGVTQATDPSQSTSLAPPARLEKRPELTVRTMATLVQFLVEKHGEGVAREVLRKGELTLEEARASSGWVSVEQVEAVFEAALELVGSEEAFIEATSFRAREALGPIAYLTWATSVGAMMDLAFRSLEFFSRVSAGGPIEKAPGRMRARYTSKYKEKRVVCLSRHGNCRALPTIWGQPPAKVEDIKCLAWGDDCCEYEITWTEPLSHGWLLAFTLLGAMVATTIVVLDDRHALAALALPLLGAAVGHFRDLKRRREAELRENRALRDGLGALSREADLARREFVELNERQRDWLTTIEREMQDRNDALQRAFAGFEGRAAENRGALRAVSHDLRNPLTSLNVNALDMLNRLEAGHMPDIEGVREQLSAIDRVKRLVDDLNAMSAGLDTIGMGPAERLHVDVLAPRLGRRAQAFALAKKLRVSAFSTRGAPETFDVQVAVFDRIVDNLLTNAVKYTSEGSIVIELGGTPGYVILKISDTGRGIAPHMLEQVFRPEGSEPSMRAPGSRGIGLSNVVRLVGLLRGKVEVLSRLEKGTTFCVYLPVNAAQAPAAAPSDVLHIRRDPAGEV